MREAVEPHFAMVGPHARVADASEPHMVVGQMDDDVVDGGAAELQRGKDAALHLLVFAEDVASKRFFEMTHDLECFVERAICHNGNHRTEDLLSHDGILKGHSGDAGGFDAQGFGVPAPAEGDARIGVAILDEAHHAVEMATADHMRPFVACEDVGAVVLMEARVQLRDEVVDDILVNKEVVGRHAGLTAVDAFAPGNALRRSLDVGLHVDDARAFPLELQHDGREMF